MLTYDNNTKVKISDFGSAMFEEEAFITQNLIPRFYRPPEIFFGCKYDCKVDIWSLGCLLFELYTGEILFSGKSNNETVKMILEYRGKPAYRYLKQGEYTNLYFRENGLGNFMSIDKDPYTNKPQIVELPFNSDSASNYLFDKLKKKFDLDKEQNECSKSSIKDLILFKEFLEKCLCCDPGKRISSIEAIVHPFNNQNKESIDEIINKYNFSKL